jgi:hypothetical protein
MIRVSILAAALLAVTMLCSQAQTSTGPVQGVVKGTETVGQGVVQGVGQAGKGCAGCSRRRQGYWTGHRWSG